MEQLTHRKLVSDLLDVPSLALPSSFLGQVLGVTGAAKMPPYTSVPSGGVRLFSQVGSSVPAAVLRFLMLILPITSPCNGRALTTRTTSSASCSEFSGPLAEGPCSFCPFIFQTCCPILLCLLLLCFRLHPPKSQRSLTICPFCPLTQCKGYSGQYR